MFSLSQIMDTTYTHTPVPVRTFMIAKYSDGATVVRRQERTHARIRSPKYARTIFCFWGEVAHTENQRDW